MRGLLLPVLFLSLLTVSPGCSEDVCEEGYEKRRECAEQLNCTSLDPSLQPLCAQKKKEFTLDYDVYLAACRMPDGSRCVCEGTEKARWEQILNCELRPETLCECQ